VCYPPRGRIAAGALPAEKTQVKRQFHSSVTARGSKLAGLRPPTHCCTLHRCPCPLPPAAAPYASQFYEWHQLSPKGQLNTLLGDQWWGARAQTGDEWMKVYLEELEKARRAQSPHTELAHYQPAGDGARAQAQAQARRAVLQPAAATAAARPSCPAQPAARCGCWRQAIDARITPAAA
jgi:hypothetical protein